MCTMSMIMDWGMQQSQRQWQDEFWRRQYEDLLRRAQKYDVDNNEPDCELDEKRQALKKIADELGVVIKFP